MEARTARRINLDDTETKMNEIFPPIHPVSVPERPITVGSIVSLRGYQIKSSHEYTYPAMTVYDVFNTNQCRCIWFVNGMQQTGIYSKEILTNRG